jgi:hemin uptake protein HemP
MDPSTRPMLKLRSDPPAPRVRASALLKGSRRLYIEHAGAVYRLEVTRQGKLILTK